jgi:hypothetical protein
MTPEEIRLELYKLRQKTNLAAIGRSLDPPVTRQSIAYVIDRRITSRRIQEAVAKAIGRDVKYVFPERHLMPRKPGRPRR